MLENVAKASKKAHNLNDRTVELLEWCIAWEIILFSGQDDGASGLRFIPQQIMAFTLFITSLLLFLKKPKLKADSSTAVMFIIEIWMLINSVALNILGEGARQGIGFNLTPKIIVLAMYLVIPLLSFKYFRENSSRL